MSFTRKELENIIKEEFDNLIKEEEIDEKLFDKLRSFGKGLINKLKKPNPKASAGVGAAFARYKIPQKPKKEKDKTDLDVIRPGLDYQPEPDIYDTDYDVSGERTWSIEPQKISGRADLKKIGPHKEPISPAAPAHQLPSADISASKTKMLKAPDEIITSSEYGETVSPNDTQIVVNLLNKYKADLKQFSIPEKETELVVGYLIANNRVLVNPTRVPKAPEEQEAQFVAEIISPSYQQGEISFDTLDNYIRNLRDFFIKERNIEIPLIHIHTIMKTIYNDGRLAISHQKLRKMGQNFPDMKMKESKTYKSFYNNWKTYTKSGVKI